MAGSLVLQSLRGSKSFTDRMDEAMPNISARTDFTIYDYMNAFQDAVVAPDGGLIKFLNSGMSPGIHSFIGRTMSGKTSFSVKLAGNIVQRYPNSTFYFRDAEKTSTSARIYSLTGWDVDTFNSKLDYQKYGINHDFIYNDIRNICQAKESLKDQIMIDTGMRDSHGKPIRIYPPDVYLVDSLPSLNPANDDEDIKSGAKTKDVFDVSEEKVNHRTEGLVIAGSNKLLIVKLLDHVYKYNIRLILINHITQNTGQIGQNSRYITKQMQFLKQDEKLPGGVSYLHQCTNITRTEFSSKIEEDEFGPMIWGTKNKMTFVKNKSNISGVPVELIFDQRSGYNSLLSAFNYIYNRGYGLDGNPRSYSLKCCPSYTFTKKNLWEKLVKDFKEYKDKAPLVNALVATAQRCVYYDFVTGRPDPNPNNWSGGSPVKASYAEGITSK